MICILKPFKVFIKHDSSRLLTDKESLLYHQHVDYKLSVCRLFICLSIRDIIPHSSEFCIEVLLCITMMTVHIVPYAPLPRLIFILIFSIIKRRCTTAYVPVMVERIDEETHQPARRAVQISKSNLSSLILSVLGYTLLIILLQ